jgi:hypothetical protein
MTWPSRRATDVCSTAVEKLEPSPQRLSALVEALRFAIAGKDQSFGAGTPSRMVTLG